MTDLTTGNIYKNFIRFGLPLIFSGLLSQAYNIVDTMIAGKFLGDDGLAAVGATAQVIAMISSLFWGFASGFSIHIACLFGSREFSKLRKDIINVIVIVSAFEILMCGIFLACCDGILNLINVDKEIYDETRRYFLVYMGGLLMITHNNVFFKILNGLGISSFQFYMSLTSGILNIVGNIVSVTVFDFGVTGIAASSVLSALVVDICYIFKIRSCFNEMGVARERNRIDFKTFFSIFKFSLPCCLQQMSMYIAAAAMSPIINGLGSEATSGYSIAMRVYDINACVYQNSSFTLSNYSAQCAGAGKYDKIKKGLFVGMLQGLTFVTPFIVCCAIFARPVNAFFYPDGFVGASLGYAIKFSRAVLPFIYFNFINNLFHSYFRGIGSLRLLLASTVIGSVLRIVSGLILGYYFGLDGVYAGLVISWIGEALFMLIIYLSRFRTTDMIRKTAINNLRL